jgi:hypothetical protein
MDPLKHSAQCAFTDRRRRPTAHPWADAYLRAHGIEDAQLRAEILKAILERCADRSASESFGPESLEDENGLVMEETQRFLDEQFAGFAGGIAPGQEALAGRVLFQLFEGPRQAPAALLDPALAPAALRFQMRTARIPKLPEIVRASMVSRRAPAARRRERPHSRRWMSLALCLLCLVLLTCSR